MPLAVVTGASSGIGRATAKLLAKENFDLVLIARRKAELDELAQDLGDSTIKIFVRPADLNNVDSLSTLFDEFQKIDVLVNCAGVANFGALETQTFFDTQRTINVNCVAVVELCRLAISKMGKGSTIINISSLGSEIPIPHMAVYSASKSFVTNFSFALREELKPKGIKVISVNPGGVKTAFIAAAGMDESVNAKNDGLLVSPEFVAQSIVRSIKRNKTMVVPVRSGPFIPILLWMLPRQFKAWLAGTQYKNFYKKG